MAVDSYRWLPRSIAELYREWSAQPPADVPFTPLSASLDELTLALVTTAGIYVEGRDAPFDAERERREPSWGDPSYRIVPKNAPRQRIGASHLHVDNVFVRSDLNVALPLDHAEDARADGRLGAVAASHYSFMGYQPDTTEWERRYAPEVADRMRAEGVSVAVLTPV